MAISKSIRNRGEGDRGLIIVCVIVAIVFLLIAIGKNSSSNDSVEKTGNAGELQKAKARYYSGQDN